MPRRLRIATAELGHVEVFAIYSTDGEWEESWRPLQGTAIAQLFTEVSKEDYDHALLGWSKPFVSALGLSPDGALIKLPKQAHECALRRGCTFFDKKTCFVTAKKLPWCFEPAGIEDAQVRKLASEAISYWRQKVYVVVVREVVNGGRDEPRRSP